jgi:hypothetical protein
MSDGHRFQCNSCDSEWQRYKTRRTIGPPSEFTYKLRCAECDFTLVVPSATDGSAWRKWKSRNSELLMSVPMIADFSETVERLVGMSSYSVVRLPEPKLNCHGCNHMMEPGLLDNIYRCPQCRTLDVVVMGEFAESISYIDSSDMHRWWTRIGV